MPNGFGRCKIERHDFSVSCAAPMSHFNCVLNWPTMYSLHALAVTRSIATALLGDAGHSMITLDLKWRHYPWVAEIERLSLRKVTFTELAFEAEVEGRTVGVFGLSQAFLKADYVLCRREAALDIQRQLREAGNLGTVLTWSGELEFAELVITLAKANESARIAKLKEIRRSRHTTEEPRSPLRGLLRSRQLGSSGFKHQ